jgi:hypothetical protein
MSPQTRRFGHLAKIGILEVGEHWHQAGGPLLASAARWDLWWRKTPLPARR